MKKKQQPIIWWKGTSGLVLPVANKQAFPPEFRGGTRLTYYASLFNSLEVNSSFYKIPLPPTFEKWATETPDDFRFTIKLWRGITHEKGFRFNPADIDRFMTAANRTGLKKGALLIQLPPGVHGQQIDTLEQLLSRVQASNPKITDAIHAWRIALEFRHTSWYNPDTYSLADRYKASIVLHDMPASALRHPPHHPDFIYLRFHGEKGDYRGSYPDPILQSYADNIKEWLAQGKTVYTYFNNTIGNAIPNLQTLEKMVGF